MTIQRMVLGQVRGAFSSSAFRNISQQSLSDRSQKMGQIEQIARERMQKSLIHSAFYFTAGIGGITSGLYVGIEGLSILIHQGHPLMASLIGSTGATLLTAGSFAMTKGLIKLAEAKEELKISPKEKEKFDKCSDKS